VPSLISGELVPTLHVERVPIAFAVCTTDEGSFAHEILLKVKEINKREDVVACGVLHGFPYQDSEFVAMSVMVTTNDDEALAEKIAKELAQWIWDNRERTLFKGYTTDQLIAKAGELLEKQGRKLVREGPVDLEKLAYGFFPDPIKQDQEKKGGLLATGALPDYSDQNRADYGPVVICDYSDNPGSGAAGDITFLLRAMIDAKLEHACMLGINDPETVQQAIDAGVGQIIKVRLGGKLDSVERGGGPIEADAYVKSISDGKIMDSCLMRGFKMDMRSTVMLIVNGVDVVVSSGYFQTLDDAFGRYHGIKPADYRVVAVKSANHFREYYRKIAVEILIADTPGLAAGAVTEFKYSCLDHDVYPHQQDARYPIS
jgi:microcystin degradation protein MlrC